MPISNPLPSYILVPSSGREGPPHPPHNCRGTCWEPHNDSTPNHTHVKTYYNLKCTENEVLGIDRFQPHSDRQGLPSASQETHLPQKVPQLLCECLPGGEQLLHLGLQPSHLCSALLQLPGPSQLLLHLSAQGAGLEGGEGRAPLMN